MKAKRDRQMGFIASAWMGHVIEVNFTLNYNRCEWREREREIDLSCDS